MKLKLIGNVTFSFFSLGGWRLARLSKCYLIFGIGPGVGVGARVGVDQKPGVGAGVGVGTAPPRLRTPARTYKESQRTNHGIRGVLFQKVSKRAEGHIKNICPGNQANKSVHLLSKFAKSLIFTVLTVFGCREPQICVTVTQLYQLRGFKVFGVNII